MRHGTAGALLLAAWLLPLRAAVAADAPPPIAARGALPHVPYVPSQTARQPPARVPAPATEQAWRLRFRALRSRIDERSRLLAIKRAELYDKIEKGETEKKPRRWAIEGFGINTEPRPGDEPRIIDPLEREVRDLEEDVLHLKRELRDLDFQASVAGVPKTWREE